MNRYILIPEDTIRVLPPEDGVEAAVEVFCSRTVIFLVPSRFMRKKICRLRLSEISQQQRRRP